MKHKLHLLIIHFNNPVALQDTIKNYISSGFPAIDIHVFDNHSDDINREELGRIVNRYKINVVLSTINQGWGRAINEFIRSRSWAEDDVLGISAHDALLKHMDFNFLDEVFNASPVLFLCSNYPTPLVCDFSLLKSFSCKKSNPDSGHEVVVGHATLCFTRPKLIASVPYDEECFIYGCESEIFLRTIDLGYKTLLTDRIIVDNPTTDASSEFRTIAFAVNSVYIARRRFGLFGYVGRMLVIALSAFRLMFLGNFMEFRYKCRALLFSLRSGGRGFRKYLERT